MLDDVVRRNAMAWRAFAGVPVWAVVKADGYGWGARRLARVLDDAVEGFFVSDADEARDLRTATSKPVALLAAGDADETTRLLDEGFIPNVASLDALAAADRWGAAHGGRARIRVGIVPAAGWSGLLPGAVGPFAQAAGRARVEVELWTHLTAPQLWAQQRSLLAEAHARFVAAGATIAGTDACSTASSAGEGHSASALVRIGIGLFGASMGGPRLECALRIEAPVTDVLRSDAVSSAGYRGVVNLPLPWLVVVRCGYSDGLPTRLAGTNNIVSIGMQYAVLSRSAPQRVGETLRLLDETSDLCMFLENTGITPHEFIVGFRKNSN